MAKPSEPVDPAEGEAEGPGQDEGKPPSAPAIVWIAPERTSIPVGETFEVAIAVADARDLQSLPFRLRYDPDLLRFAGGRVGPLLDGADVAFLVTPRAPGELVVGLSRLGAGSVVSGSGDAALLRFVGRAAGVVRLGFEGASVRGVGGRRRPARFQGAAIVLTTPEVGTKTGDSGS
jgi:hypothetical protein